MSTSQQNITLIALGGLVVALIAALAVGWHRTTPGLGRDLVCENPHLVNTLKLEPCGNYGFNVLQTGDYPSNPGGK